MRLAPLLVAMAGGTAGAAEEAARGTARLGGSSTPPVLEAIAGLAVVLAVIFLLAWAVRRFTHLQGGGRGLVRVVGGVALGSRERAVVVAVGNTRLLLGVAPGQVRMLHVLPPEEPATGFAAELDLARDRTAP